MRRSHGFFAGALALLVAISFAYFTAPLRLTPPPSVSQNTGWSAPIWTGGTANAMRHWQKHGQEFPQYSSAQSYIRGAHDFLLHPPAGTLVKHRPNGDTLYFDPQSDTFAVRAENGAPRTYFKPNAGMEYWQRQ